MTITSIIDFLINWYILFPLYLIVPLTVIGVIFAPFLKDIPYTRDDKGNVIPGGKKGFYTEYIPGLVKIIVKGETPLAFIMNFTNHKLGKPPVEDGNTRVNLAEEYNVIPEEGGKQRITSAIPLPTFWSFSTIPFFSLKYLWWLSKVIVFSINGMIFTGVPPWRTVRIYRLDYLKLEKGEIKQASVYSNHFRVMPFDIYIVVPEVETSDNVKLKVTLHIIAKVTNPWLTAFAVSPGESWYTRISSLSQGITRNFYMSKTYAQTLELENKSELTDAITALGNLEKLKESIEKGGEILNSKKEIPLLYEIGMEVIQSVIYDQTILDSELAASLAAIAKATADAKGRVIQAKGEATATENITAAVEANGENGRLVYEKESTIRTVKAAPPGAIVSINTSKGSDTDSDAIRKGILAEIKKKNESKD